MLTTDPAPPPRAEFLDQLRSGLGDCMHVPGTAGYRASLDGVFFPDASRRAPLAVVHPRTVGDVATVMTMAVDGGGRVTGPTLGPTVADGLVEAIRHAPTTACRIDFQHTGGALADVADGDTAFWGRGGEWNVPLDAIWSDPDDGDAWFDWARQAPCVLAPATIGVYSVEVRPGFSETEREIESASGANLSRLRSLRWQHDPAGVLACYPL